MADSARIVDGDITFRIGMDSANDPEQIAPGMYCRAFNAVKRGGKVQCRPGYRQKLHLPTGQLQGLVLFTTTDDVPLLVFAVAGKVYWSEPPYSSYTQLPNVQFRSDVDTVYFQPTVWSVQRNDDGSLTLVRPRSVLFMQDGYSAPAYFDGGGESGHLFGEYSTPLGTIMAWSGSRLWVARDRRLFASDIGNPFSFFEGEYIGVTGINAFILPGLITGMAEVDSVELPYLLVFTSSTGTAIQSNVLQRSTWASIPNFQKVILPEIGCTSHKSLVKQFGQLWWFTPAGLTRLDVALQSKVESKFSYIDTNMAWSKRFLSEDLSNVAGAAHENYLLMSVPWADQYNRHTWVYDSSGLETNEVKLGGGWDSYWVGTRPVQWATGKVDGVQRIFHVSRDRDGQNRLWEAFQADRLDNNCPIYWGVETRGYTGGSKQPLQYRYCDVFLSELSGNVYVAVDWAGTRRGRYKRQMTKTITATTGSIRFDVPLDASDSNIYALKKQSRRVRTQERRRLAEDTLTSCGVESDEAEFIDFGFQLFISASGPGSIDCIRFYSEPESEKREGTCEPNEAGEHATRFDGAAAADDIPLSVVDTLSVTLAPFSAAHTAVAAWNGYSEFGSGLAYSWICQAAADKEAEAIAQMRAAKALEFSALPVIGGGAFTSEVEIVV